MTAKKERERIRTRKLYFTRIVFYAESREREREMTAKKERENSNSKSILQGL